MTRSLRPSIVLALALVALGAAAYASPFFALRVGATHTLHGPSGEPLPFTGAHILDHSGSLPQCWFVLRDNATGQFAMAAANMTSCDEDDDAGALR